jgi:hypothetical protein
LPIQRTHPGAAAQTGTFHAASAHQTLGISRSTYRLRIPEVW